MSTQDSDTQISVDTKNFGAQSSANTRNTQVQTWEAGTKVHSTQTLQPMFIEADVQTNS